MRTPLLAYLLLLFGLLLTGCRDEPGTASRDAETELSSEPELPEVGVVTDSLVRRVAIPSQVMRKVLNAYVILPESYYLDTNKVSYPVVYLLHGYDGNFANWYERVPALRDYASQFDFIIVTPEGGAGSWYIDSPLDTTSQFESYIGLEVPQYIDNNFRSLRHAANRAIGGLSMGGHGALRMGLLHPDWFGACGSLSGVLNLEPYPGRWEIERHLGSLADSAELWRRYSVINLVQENLRPPAIYIDCGLQDFLLEDNRGVHYRLEDEGIPHVYVERPGGHSWDYWAEATPYLLLFFADFFARGPK